MKKARDTIEGFEELEQHVTEHLRKKGFVKATGPQRSALRPIMAGRDVLLIAPTGFGKTEATFAPLLQKIMNGNAGGIQLLYIAPLRALNRDILLRMKGWCSDLGISIAVRHSDTTKSERTKQSRRPPQVMVTTPETLQIMFTGSLLRKALANIKHVIVDEIHEMYGEERGAQLDFALSRLDRLTGRSVQRIGLSATVWDPEDVARFLGGDHRDVKVVKGTWSKEYSFKVDSPLVTDHDREVSREIGCSPKVAAVMRRMVELMESVRSTLIFVNSRDLAEALTTRLRAFMPDLSLGIHHGSLSREARMEMEDGFKNGEIKGMVCTSSLELGMDIGIVDLVIQFKSPKEISRLIQRAGRAGHRAGDVSRCVILATEGDDVLEAGVIANLALANRLERRGARKEILSVLSNQILSMAAGEGIRSIDDLWETARRTYTFSSLTRERLVRMLRFLNDMRALFLDEEAGTVRGGRKAREYFYDNISMIPDERVMLIRDISTRSIIGSLDMDFVLSNLEQYSKFIVRGQPWRVVDIREEEVIVEPVTDLGPVPAWSGSDIPVPWEVAREVARVRGDLVNHVEKGGDPPAAFTDLPLTDDARDSVRGLIEEQKEGGFATPDRETVTLEYGLDGFVIGICGGTRTNETMGRVIASLLTARYGSTVIVDYDPYRILLKGDLRLKPGDIEWAIGQFPVDDMPRMLPVLLKNSPLLRWQMLHVAKKFGVIKRDVDPLSFPLKRLMARWRDTLIMEEALERIIHGRLDTRNTPGLVREINTGDVRRVVQKISPLSMSGSCVRSEFMTPENAGSEVIRAVRERLETTAVRLTCMSCGAKLRGTAIRARTIAGCHRCGSRLLAPLHTGDIRTQKDVEKGLKGKRLDGDEKRRFDAAVMAAQLFSSYGHRAVLCMAGRGVGSKTAGRILEVLYDDEDELVKRIFAEEIRFARTKRFWD